MQKKKQGAQKRAILDHAKKMEMMAILVRNQKAFEEVQDTLQVRHVRWIGEGMALVWHIVRQLYDAHSEMPAKGMLDTELSAAQEADGSVLTDTELEEVRDFVEYAFDDAEHGKDISQSVAHRKVAVDSVRMFLSEVTARQLQDSLMADGQIPTDMVGALDAARTELEVASALTDIDLDVPFPEGWDTRERVALFTTGCAALDQFMGGGWRGKECLLFMGPYGSMKTTVVCHCVSRLVQYAKEEYEKATALHEKKLKKGKKSKPPKRPVVVLIFTEGDKDTYRCRLLSHMARVPWKKLAQMKSIKSLSNAKKPGEDADDGDKIGTAYENEFFKDAVACGGFINERNRVGIATAQANQHLVLIDCTDSDDSARKIGKGGIPEIAAVVRRYFSKHSDCRPLAFFVDHVSALADRICEATGAEADEKLHLILKRMPRQAVDKLGKPFNAPVALMHQLSGEANKRGVTSKYHHADAAGGRSIGEYVDWAVMTGPTDSDGMAVWDVTKHRREPPQSRRVVKVVGNFQTVKDMHETHYVPAGGREIMTRDHKEHHKAQKGDIEYKGELV